MRTVHSYTLWSTENKLITDIPLYLCVLGVRVITKLILMIINKDIPSAQQREWSKLGLAT